MGRHQGNLQDFMLVSDSFETIAVVMNADGGSRVVVRWAECPTLYIPWEIRRLADGGTWCRQPSSAYIHILSTQRCCRLTNAPIAIKLLLYLKTAAATAHYIKMRLPPPDYKCCRAAIKSAWKACIWVAAQCHFMWTHSQVIVEVTLEKFLLTYFERLCDE